MKASGIALVVLLALGCAPPSKEYAGDGWHLRVPDGWWIHEADQGRISPLLLVGGTYARRGREPISMDLSVESCGRSGPCRDDAPSRAMLIGAGTRWMGAAVGSLNAYITPWPASEAVFVASVERDGRRWTLRCRGDGAYEPDVEKACLEIVDSLEMR